MRTYWGILLIALAVFSCKDKPAEADQTGTVSEETASPEPNFAYGFNLDEFRVVADTVRSGDIFGELMMENKEHLAAVMTEEQGKPLKAALNEVQYGADFLLWFAEEGRRAYGRVVPPQAEGKRHLVIRQPVGVVGAACPPVMP